MTFNGFISYSHAADGRLAPALQRGLHRLAKPWHRRRALWIFRDQTGLSVTPALWSSIQGALDRSDFFVLLASPEAARSRWVNREIEHWVAKKSPERILPVVTDGEWRWDPESEDFAPDSTAVPAALRGVFVEEPLFLDLRWARDDRQLSLRHSRFRNAVAQLAAPMHGVSKDDLEGEDVRLHRRAQRLRSASVTALVLLALAASVASVLAMRNAERATVAAREARHQQQVAFEQHGSAQRSATEARRQEELARRQQKLTQEAAEETRRQEQLTRDQKALAAKASAEAGRQQQNAVQQQEAARREQENAKQQKQMADRAATHAREQERVAQQQRDLAQQWADEARRQEQVAQEQERLAREAAAEARQQQAKADEQLRIAISRRLVNQAKATIANDPTTALRFGAAADRLHTDAETRRQLAGILTSTHYAGTLGGVTEVEFSSTGVLAAIGDDGKVSLWNVADRANPVRLATLDDDVARASLAFSADGHTLVVAEAGSADADNGGSGNSGSPTAGGGNGGSPTAGGGNGGSPTAGSGNSHSLSIHSEHMPVVLWDVANPAHPVRIGSLPADDGFTSMALSPDGRTIATRDPHNTATLWDVTDRARPTRLGTLLKSGGLERFGFSPDGRTLVTRAEGMTAWDLTDRSHPVRLGSFGSSLYTRSFAFNPKRPILAVASEAEQPWSGDRPAAEGNVTLWDMTDPARPQLRATEQVGAQIAKRATFSANGRILTASAEAGSIQWDLMGTDQHLWLARLNTLTSQGDVRSAAVSPDGQTLVTADTTGSATLWNVESYGAPHPLTQLIDDRGEARATAFSPDGRIMATVGEGTVEFFDMSDPAHAVRVATVEIQALVAFSHDLRTMATAGSDGHVTLSDVSDPTRPVTRGTLDVEVDHAHGILFSPDGRTLVVDTGTQLALWDVAVPDRPSRLGTIPVHGIGIPAFSPDGRTLAVGTSTGTVTLWDLSNRTAPIQVGVLAGHVHSVEQVAFSPDGRTVAAGSSGDQRVMLWDVTNRADPHRLTSLTGMQPGPITFSPDGRTLAVVSWASSAALWDVTDRVDPIKLATISLYDSRLHLTTMARSIAFSPDGHTLVFSSDNLFATTADTAFTIYDYAALNDVRADPARRACAIAGRGLTAEEWSRYVPELPYEPTCAR